jgi:AAA+ ATPase superfamily predicted ATPase
MHRIFEDYSAPLFGRATGFLRVRPFPVSILKTILHENHLHYTPEDLLALYAFTGGIAKYVQLFVDNRALSFKKMVDLIIQEDSPFITDGKTMLIEEFGRDYAVYFTILSAIARGENRRSEIEASVGKEVGGYLTRLEKDYGLIAKSTPLFSKTETKNVRYIIEDNFLTFWFRFIYKYSYMIEIVQYGELKKPPLKTTFPPDKPQNKPPTPIRWNNTWIIGDISSLPSLFLWLPLWLSRESKSG